VAESEVVRRYGRAGRWLHAGVYITVLVLLAGGWWFVLVGYRRPSPLARALGVVDADIHELAGYGLAAVVLLWLPFGIRGVAAFVRETLRFRRGDGRWLVGWPRAVFTGRFGDHEGHFDPGQRLANIVMVGTLLALVLSGFGMLFLPDVGPDLPLLEVHRWSTFLATPVLLGHILIASGLLPGYRGVWRSMHLGGNLPVDVARRIWPSWLDEQRRR
jgi:cytochrome b subunit of formate dehydrogenase